MSFLLFNGYLCLLALAVMLVFQKGFGHSLVVAVTGISLFYYLCSLFLSLSIGFTLCLIIGILALGLIGYCLFIKKQKIVFRITPAMMIYLVAVLSFWWIHKNRYLVEWDEFSHWGLVVKNMHVWDTIRYTPLNTDNFPGYPPIAALFEYLCMSFGNGYTENSLIRAMALLNVVFLLPLISEFEWKDWKKLIVFCILLFIIPLSFFERFYDQIYVDHLLGSIFLYLILSNWLESKYDWFYFIRITLSLAFLVLVKTSGIGLGIIAILINYFVITKKTRTKAWSLRYFLVTVGSLLIAKYSWDIFVQVTGATIAWESISNLTITNVIRFITGKGWEYQYYTQYSFLKTLFTFNIGSGLLGITWFMGALFFIGFILYGVSCKRKKGDTAYLRLSVSLLIGLIVYSFTLLVLYLFTYSEYEAINLSSFSRYMATCLWPAITICVYIVINNELLSSKRIMLKSVCFLLSLFLFINYQALYDITINAQAIAGGTEESHEDFYILEYLGQVLKPSDRVYIVADYDLGYVYQRGKYLLTPVQSNLPNDSWSIISLYDENDIWTIPKTKEEWEETLAKNYQYVYLYTADPEFIQTFGSLFAPDIFIGDGMLYQVTIVDNHVVLIPATQLQSSD
jgi:hypothetical protein